MKMRNYLNEKQIKNPKELAILFHNTYERLAPKFGYENTQGACPRIE